MIIFPPETGSVTVAFGEEAVSGRGPTVQSGTAPIILTEELIGESIKHAIHALAGVGTSLSWLEVSEK